jgi:hypothetical protein
MFAFETQWNQHDYDLNDPKQLRGLFRRFKSRRANIRKVPTLSGKRQKNALTLRVAGQDKRILSRSPEYKKLWSWRSVVGAVSGDAKRSM